MKKILIAFSLLLMLTFVFSGCDNSNDLTINYPCHGYYQSSQNSKGEWEIGGPVNNYSEGTKLSNSREVVFKQTRTAAIETTDIINEYDEFSLFTWNTDSVVMNNYNGTINNNTYIWGYKEAKKYFDNNAPKYSIIGIIPYNGNLTLKNDKSIDVSLEDFTTEGYTPNEKKYKNEFIVAKTEVEKANYSQGATLNFYHQNSIVRVKFETNSGNNLEILDFTPYVPEVPASSGTVVEKQSKMFDELVAGNTVGWPYLVGTENSTYSGSAGTYMNYQGSNASTARITNARLAELMPLVNAQFIYTDENGNNVSNVDWVKGVEKKNTVFLKFADGVDTDAFLAGNDAFWTNLTEEEKTAMQNWYTSGIRVARINQIGDGNYFVWGMLNNQMTVTVISGATPYQPASGKKGIVVLPATSDLQTGKDAQLSTFPSIVTANVSLNGVTYTTNSTVAEVIFTKAGNVAYSIYSPTNWYTFPVQHVENFGFTIKFSYTLNGVTRYDARVFVPAVKCNWQAGKWYDYVIKVNTNKFGKADPSEADPTDPKIEDEYPITITTTIDQYSAGETYTFEL